MRPKVMWTLSRMSQQLVIVAGYRDGRWAHYAVNGLGFMQRRDAMRIIRGHLRMGEPATVADFQRELMSTRADP